MAIPGTRCFVVALFVSVLLSGCDGGSSSGGGSFNQPITGSWTGTWENDELGPGSENQGTTNEGIVRIRIVENSNGEISGTALWTGFSCFLNANITGIVSVGGVSLTFTSGASRVTFNGRRVTEARIRGRWDNDVGCVGEGDLVFNREL